MKRRFRERMIAVQVSRRGQAAPPHMLQVTNSAQFADSWIRIDVLEKLEKLVGERRREGGREAEQDKLLGGEGGKGNGSDNMGTGLAVEWNSGVRVKVHASLALFLL